MTNEESTRLGIKLHKVFPLASMNQIATTISALARLGRQADRNGENECNRPPMFPGEFEKARARIEAGAVKAIGELGKPRGKIAIEVGGDPRGFCLKLHHKAIGGNTWGGDESGWGIN